MSILIVTGTGTDVGKTVATAALAACAGGTVAVVKLAQTGVRPEEAGDLAEITRLSGVTDTFEFARYPAALAPHHAALRAGVPPLDKEIAMRRIEELDARYDLVLVEGAGGLLVPYEFDWPWTIGELATDLCAPMVLVTNAGLGTINHTALAFGWIEENVIPVEIVIGSWPAEADLAARMNLFDLGLMTPKYGLAGVLPAGMSTMRDFAAQARAALAPRFGGTFDWRAFRNSFRL